MQGEAGVAEVIAVLLCIVEEGTVGVEDGVKQLGGAADLRDFICIKKGS